jgi:hypothetical protein
MCIAAALTATTARAATRPQVLFDDFDYAAQPQPGLARHGWIVRTAPGWPGAKGVTWPASAISVVNGLLRLTATTDGTAAGTTQAQICQARKFYEGTYATRVRFEDAPDAGPDGDQLVETFYAISPYRKALDPSYSELDWEYLPNNGWGVTVPTLFVTSWATVRLDPWLADNTHDSAPRSLAGWHTFVLQVAHGTVRYYLDGVLLGVHGGKYFPNVPMSINYNLWFIDGGLLPQGATRRYHEDVDWVYHRVDTALSPRAVTAAVEGLRHAHVAFRDTVPAKSPPLRSPCDL